MDAISGSLSHYSYAQDQLATATTRLAEGAVTPETVTAQEQALTLLDVQTELLETALAAQTHVLDLLV